MRTAHQEPSPWPFLFERQAPQTPERSQSHALFLKRDQSGAFFWEGDLRPQVLLSSSYNTRLLCILSRVAGTSVPPWKGARQLNWPPGLSLDLSGSSSKHLLWGQGIPLGQESGSFPLSWPNPRPRQRSPTATPPHPLLAATTWPARSVLRMCSHGSGWCWVPGRNGKVVTSCPCVDPPSGPAGDPRAPGSSSARIQKTCGPSESGSPQLFLPTPPRGKEQSSEIRLTNESPGTNDLAKMRLWKCK